MFCGNADLSFGKFLQFYGKRKRNRHCLELNGVNYPATNFGRFNYFYRTHRTWNNLPKNIFDGIVNVKKFNHALPDTWSDSRSGY